MTDNALQIAPARISVDPTHDGNILIVAIDDGLEDSALWLTPATAAKLGQRLVNDERQGDLDGAHPSHGAQQIAQSSFARSDVPTGLNTLATGEGLKGVGSCGCSRATHARIESACGWSTRRCWMRDTMAGSMASFFPARTGRPGCRMRLRCATLSCTPSRRRRLRLSGARGSWRGRSSWASPWFPLCSMSGSTCRTASRTFISPI